MSCTFSFYRNCGRGRDCSQESQRSNHKSTLACEPQTYFWLSLLSLRKERSDDQKYVCGSQATIKEPSLCKVPSLFVQAKSEAFIDSGKCYSF